MKLAWTVATPDTADESMLAWRGPVPWTFEQLRALGYTGVELMVRDPRGLDQAEIARAASDCGLTIAAVSTGQLRKEDGLSLNSADADLRLRTVDRTREVVDFAAHWKAQLNIGTLRGQLGKDRENGKRYAAESLSRIVDYASGCGVRVAIEPQCRWVSDWLNTAEETVWWMRTWTRSPHILFDVYHSALEEQSVYAALIANRPFIDYVQLSDLNRLPPGSGSTHFGEILRVLAALQYQGFLCVECRQTPDSARAAEQAAACLRPVLKTLQQERTP